MSEIDVTVLGVVRRGEAFLVQRLVDPADWAFHRPIGGGVEFGETSAAALEREFREELDAAVSAGPVVGTIENRYGWNGDPAHEIAILRAAEFVDETLYERDRFQGIDGGGAVEYEATWKSLGELTTAPEPLYPDGLARLLRGGPDAADSHIDGG